MIRFFKLFAIFLFFAKTLNVHAQTSSKGKLFYFSFMEMLTVSTTGEPDSLLVYMTCDVNTKVTIDNPRVSGSAQTMNLVAGAVNRFSADPTNYYPVGSEFASSSKESKKCIRISSKDPISVYCLNMEVVRTDGTFVLPYEAIPKAPEFYVTAFTPNRMESSNYMPSEFVVVGMDNNVQVEITPTTRTAGGKPAGTAFTVTLSRGQVYQVQSHPSDGNVNSPTDLTGDLTGTRIRVINGCGKINVFAGMRTAKMPALSCSTIDHLYTQVFPTSILGTKHVLMPFATQTGGYVFRVIATKPNTKIFVDGTYIGTTRGAGKYYYEDVTTSDAKCITSDSPVYVVQFMKSSGCSGNSSEGDPAILIMPDYNQKMLKATVGTATTTNMNKHYVNILVSKSAKSIVKLNGSFLSNTIFKDVTCAGLSYAQVSVSNPSSNTIECDSGVIVVAYGAGPTESYSYCGGALFENLEFDIKLTRASKCPNYPVSLQAITNAKNVKKYLWKFGDGFTDTGKNVVHSYKKTGSFYTTVSAIVPAPCGGFDTTSRSVIVNVLPGPLYDMPDTLFQCKTQLSIPFTPPLNSKYIYKWQDSSSAKTFTATKAGKVWLKLTDTSTNCFLFDSTVVLRFDPIKAGISYDTMRNCFRDNFFSLSDKTIYSNDQYKSAKWAIKMPPYGLDSIANTSRFRFHSDTLLSYPLTYYVLSKNGCRDTLKTTLLVHSMPEAHVQYMDTEYCQLENINFKDSSIHSVGIQQAYWDFGNGKSDSGLSITYKYSQFDTFTVVHVAKTANGCRDTSNVTVVIHPLPQVTFAVTIDNPCNKANSFGFADNSKIPYGTISNQWRYEGNLVNNRGKLGGVHFSDTGKWDVVLIQTSNLGCIDSLKKQVYVAPEPKAIIQIPDSNTCFNTHYFHLKNVSKLTSGSLANAKWEFSNGTVFSGNELLKKKFTAPGNYSLKLKVISNTYNCADSITRNVKVSMSPSAQFSVNDSTQCDKNQQYSFTPKFPESLGAYQWQFGDGQQLLTENAAHQYANVGVYSVRFVIKSAEACTDTAYSKVVVDSTPVAAFTITVDSMCQDVSGTDFINTTQFGNGFSTFWILGDATTASTLNVSNKVYGNAGRYTVKLIVTAANGCKDTASQFVQIMPVPAASVAVNDSAQCLLGNNFVITNNSSTNGALGLQYSWKLNGINAGNTNQINPLAFTDTGYYILNLRLVSSFGCADSIVQRLYVAESPQISIQSDAPACLGEPVNYTSIAGINSGSIVGYSWSFGDGNTSTQSNPSHAFTSSGTFNSQCTVVSDKGCSTTSAAHAVLIHPLPTADFSFEQLASRGMETDHKLIFTGNGATDYLWKFHDGSTAGGVGPILKTFTDTGHRLARLVVWNSTTGCRDSIAHMLYLKPELKMWIPLSFTPNDDGLNETFGPSTVFGLSRFNMFVYDRWGHRIYITDQPSKPWNGLDEYGEKVPDGVYAYEMNFRYIDGKLYVYRGTITLLR